MQRLKSNFKANGGWFKEYKIGDLFISSNGDTDIQQTDINGLGEYVVSSGESNAGVIGKTNRKARIFEANTITVDMFGFVQYRSYPYKMVTHARVFSLKPQIKFDEKIGLYIVALMHCFRKMFSYSEAASWKKVSEMTLSLPTKADGSIDFDYMQRYIAQLEAERVAQLEAYLKAAGLENATLTEKEQKALMAFRNGEIEFSSFRIGDLFEKCDLKFKKKKFNKEADVSKEKTREFNLPLVNAKDGNNGIMYYGKEQDFEAIEMSIDIVNDGAISTGNVYPQPQKTGVLYNAYLIKYKMKVSERLLMFFAQSIQKSIKLKFDYAKKASWKRVKNEFIQLPILNGNIDGDFVEAFISAQQKLAIKDMIAWKDKVIQETQNLIEC